ncbi:exonuclease domain-containing protein [Anaerobacillus isosaccharinicus]|uniref:3'-5' exoribonuclease n=1 Tax=Anaerobacillus isosaccharinicus TaxID=1532552 RepID=A0A1S2LIL9_9BACI|nr:exonuclease domain-containing protein [Anaerobacillus isosaccharinicus]MBA5586126.1 3'-5' exoribonuclease [Anaerobacillus isosaccharinicus]QOY35606.1 3'-5' exoribonuclease [Anaerobacillus isosaccharinicus]
MNMNQMMQFLRQIPGKLGANSYSSIANQNEPSNIAYLRQIQREMKKQDVLEVPFDELKLVVFDIETTGFHPYKGDQILSIGAVKIHGGNVLENETFYSLVYNEKGPTAEIEALTGIFKQDLLDAPPMNMVLNDFFQFVQSDPLVAHHANHERNFMQHVTWTILKTSFEHRVIDTSFITKIADPLATFVTLDEWCSQFGILFEKRHHALHDALATAKLWLESIRLVEEKGFHCLKDVYSHLASKKY